MGFLVEKTTWRERTLLALSVICFFLPALPFFWLGLGEAIPVYVPIAPTVGGLATLSILYLSNFRIGTVAASLEPVRWHLAYGIRLSQHQVSESFSTLRVQVDSTSEVEISLKTTLKGIVISYKAGATDTGWATMVVPLVTVWPSIIALFTSLWIYIKCARYVRNDIFPLLPADGVLRHVVSHDDIGAMLVKHAAEDHRLFSEAYEADRDTYWDALAVIVCLAFFGWFVLFVILNATSADPDYMHRVMDALVPSIAGALACAIPSIWIVRRRLKPRMTRWRNWMTRVDRVWKVEATKSMPEDSAPSSFEVLSEATKDAPMLMKSLRKAAIDKDWNAWSTLIFFIWLGMPMIVEGYWSMTLFAIGQSGNAFPVLAIPQVGGGFALLVVAWIYYNRWKRRQDAVVNQELANWNHRHEEPRHRMERFLEKLQSDV